MSSFYCQPCRKNFRWYEDLQEHLLCSGRHNYCAACRCDFRFEEARQYHHCVAHQSSFCQFCQAETTDIHIHNLTIHDRCPICGQLCEDADAVHRHCGSWHADHYCEICPRLFLHPNDRTTHYDAHGPCDIECPHHACDKRFGTRGALVQHWESKTCKSGINVDWVASIFKGCDKENRFVDKDFETTGIQVSNYRDLDATNQFHPQRTAPVQFYEPYKCPSAQCRKTHGCDSVFPQTLAPSELIHQRHADLPLPNPSIKTTPFLANVRLLEALKDVGSALASLLDTTLEVAVLHLQPITDSALRWIGRSTGGSLGLSPRNDQPRTTTQPSGDFSLTSPVSDCSVARNARPSYHSRRQNPH
ncbi:hypothetical protein MJO28_005657 [Puccinia striiformis f. sp. tritici]|uniref:C2H2-type domain-containing protein n=2 Tax=Puccinia striiformis TaxID=27350 RepID=A0A2S4V9Z3_9BASI|nr:hypothetical protein MJO28_005657 [Puccinia striiformis f. sp. tritici]POW06285.1 hypothetical protein PSTT_09162 [Puccinia striiformis]